MSQLNVDTIGSQTSTSISVASGHTLKNSSGNAFITSSGFNYISGADSTTQASSLSVDNVFSSAYDVYKIIVFGNTASANSCQLQLRMRAGGSDATSTYRGLREYANIGASGLSHGSDTGSSYWYIGDITSSQPQESGFEITLHKPYLAQHTNFMSIGSSAWSDSAFYLQRAYGLETSNTQFDGFTILPINGSHTFNLAYRVYGLSDSL